MQCHLNPECKNFKIKPIYNIENKKLHSLYKSNEVYMLFKTQNSYVKMFMPIDEYLKNQDTIKKHILLEYLLYFLILILESFLFALYALRPLRKALQLNEEFVKDILHDFNTPLSALTINLKILKKKFGNNDAINRSDNAIQNILSLQDNLHYYIKRSKLQTEIIQLDKLLKDRVKYFQTIYVDISISTDIHKYSIHANKDIFTRIIDNILSNACKYNKKDGTVFICLKNDTLTIEDTGIGIRNPHKVFQRHYKEQSTGVGIGLNIVHKLCQELQIKISVESQTGVGSKFILHLF